MKKIFFQQGVSIYLSVLILTVILAMAMGLGAILFSQLKNINEMALSAKAFYIADTGIEHALYNRKISGSGDVSADFAGGKYNTEDKSEFWNPTAVSSEDPLESGEYFFTLAGYNGKVYAATCHSGNRGTVYYLDNTTITWKSVPGAPDKCYKSTAVFDGKLWLGTCNTGEVYYIDSSGAFLGSIFSAGSQCVHSLTGYSFIPTINLLYAGADSGKIYSYNLSSGATNEVFTTDEKTSVYSLIVFGARLYAGTGPFNGKIYAFNAGGGTFITDYGPFGDTNSIYSFAFFGGKLYAGTGQNAKIYEFDSTGEIWSEFFTLNGFPLSIPPFENKDVSSLVVNGMNLYAAIDNTSASAGNNARIYKYITPCADPPPSSSCWSLEHQPMPPYPTSKVAKALAVSGAPPKIYSAIGETVYEYGRLIIEATGEIGDVKRTLRYSE